MKKQKREAFVDDTVSVAVVSVGLHDTAFTLLGIRIAILPRYVAEDLPLLKMLGKTG